MKQLVGHEHALKDIFSKKFEFHIPSYQRPYAWTKDHTEELFQDIHLAFNENGKDPYFLGSVVLVKEETKSMAEVIDGQQRLTTLTILIAALKNKLIEQKQLEKALPFNSYIIETGNLIENIDPKPRLFLREQEKDFFKKNIQGSTSCYFDKNLKTKSESEQNIVNNYNKVVELLDKYFNERPDELLKFGQYLINDCFLIAVETRDINAAFRIFSVLNTRGLDLQHSDILKAEIIGKIDVSKRDEYTEKWEEAESILGRDNFNMLFSHIRMIYVKKKASESILKELQSNILCKMKKSKDYEDFIDNELLPYVDAYNAVINKNIQKNKLKSKIDNYLQWLSLIGNNDWVPPTIYFIKKNQNDYENILKFLVELERLAAMLLITQRQINTRIERYAEVLNGIDGTLDPDDYEDGENFSNDAWYALELYSQEKEEFAEQLEGDIYKKFTGTCRYILLRLDSFLSDGTAKYDNDIVTIEHVLPQTVELNSEWERIWNAKDLRENWVHKIGNLVLLSKRKNSKAQNYPFHVKKEKYFSGDEGVSPFVLTTQVIQEEEWIPDVVAKRQQRLLSKLKEKWKIKA